MAGKNQVTLTFAGDTGKLEKAFSSVGSAADTMATKVHDSGSKFDTLGESTDRTATKASTAMGAMGALGSGLTLLGVQGGAANSALLGLGLGFDALSGVTDIATLALESHTVKLIASKVATLAVSAATKAWTAIQWLLNLALDANPIGLIITIILILVVVIVNIATKTHWFQNIWHAAWSGIKTAAKAVWDWLKDLPGMIGKAFAKVGDWIFAPFKWAFNMVADAWNSTIGKIHFKIPSWIPGIGGKSFDMPNIPRLHTGGIVPGAPGSEALAILQAGERVTPAGATTPTVMVAADDGTIVGAVLAAIRRQVAMQYGGDVTIALAGV